MLSILFAQYGTIADIEIVWTLIAASGLVFSLFNLREAWQDRRALKEAKIGNGRSMIATHAVRNEAARGFIQFIFLTIGLLTMTYADPMNSLVDQPWNIIAISFVFKWGLITSAILIALKSYWSFQLRRKLRERIISNDIAGIKKVDVKGEIVVSPDSNGENKIVATLEGPLDEDE